MLSYVQYNKFSEGFSIVFYVFYRIAMKKIFEENQNMINFWRDLHRFSSLEVIIVLISSHSQLETLKTYWITFQQIEGSIT